jgi:phage I-like protein
MSDTDSHDNFVCLADLPELAAAADGGDDPKSRITLFRVGRFKHPRFGRWNITKEVLEGFIANFRARGRVAIDFDHAPEEGGSTIAAGWITDLHVEGDELKADVEWTDLGADAIRKKRYLFISPTWNLAGQDETGTKVGPKLIGAGLTNRPFFPWPALSLSTQYASAAGELAVEVDDEPPEDDDAVPALLAPDEVPLNAHQLAHLNEKMLAQAQATRELADAQLAAAQANANRPGDLQVTEPFLKAPDLPTIDDKDQLQAAVDAYTDGDDLKAHLVARAKDLKCEDLLPEGWAAASQEKPEELDPASDSRARMAETNELTRIAKALELDEGADLDAIVAAAEQAVQPKTLRGVVETPEGDTIMSRAEALSLQDRADAGDIAVKELKELTFASAFDRAIRQGRAAPAMETHYKRYYDADQTGCLAALDELPPLVSTAALGASGHQAAKAATSDFSTGERDSEIDRDSLALHERAEAYCAAHEGADYADVYVSMANGRI